MKNKETIINALFLAFLMGGIYSAIIYLLPFVASFNLN